MLLEIPDVLTAAQVRQCRDALAQAAWDDGQRTAGYLAARTKNNQQLAQNDPLAVQLGDFVLDRLGGCERFIAAALPLKVLPPRFNRYAGGGNYGGHIDNAIFGVPGTPHRIRSDLSATLFLSEPDDYDGGELVVRGDFGEHSFKLPAGHMLLYSGTTVHRVTRVTRGERVAAFFWVQSLIRQDGQRDMLLELDDTIRDLAGKLPDDPALVRLTGLYHNLLRQWADT